MGRLSPLLVATLFASLAAAAYGCGSSDGGPPRFESTPVASTTPPASPVLPDAGVVDAMTSRPPAEPIPDWDDSEALAWLEKECASCHGVDKTTGAKKPYYSAWPLEARGITKSFLETSEYTPIAYQTILHRAIDAEGASPSPMPLAKPDDAKRLELKAMLQWWSRAVPYAVIDADARYGNDASKHEKVVVDFHCASPASLRSFLSRVTMGALDRPPSAAEYALFSRQELSDPVTLAQRTAIVRRLESEWRGEFLSVGLRKLATAIGGGPGIQATAEIPAATADDLRQELYQLMLAKYASESYEGFFTSNVVMASPKTAPLYGCPAGTDWTSCTLAAPRGGFFTTLGFLNSRPQSFLIEANNHGRIAALYFTLYGEGLLAATDGPSGEATPPLPDCLDDRDTRAYQSAPRGSVAVPEFGKVCQSCHLSRNMAAGSVLFRPFSMTGQVYTGEKLGTAGSPDKALYDLALAEAWKYTTKSDGQTQTQQVNGTFLTGLLIAPPKACVATGNPKAPYVPVASVGELAAQLMKNRPAVARGFMRHAHRAFSNLTTITLEMGVRAMSAFDAGQPKLPDLVRAYFLSDSMACEAKR